MIQCSYNRLGLYLILVGLVALTLVLTNCGGGGGGNGDGDGGSSDTGDNVQQGVFLDSAVEKIDYQTATQSGETDADGTFNYMSGETVTFSIGDLAIGSAPGQDTVTPVDIVPGATDETDPTVTNITIFLLGLDEDGDPSNGILITDDIADIVSDYDIDFDQTTEDFLADQNMVDLLNELNNEGVFTASTPREWPSADDAQIHLAGTLAGITSITGESGNQVNLNGDWDTGCKESDDEELAATRRITTISGSTFSHEENQWYESITCNGTSDLTLVISGTFVLGNEVTADLLGSDVTATEMDLVITSFEATINNPALVADFNAEPACGFDDWVVDTPKELFGSSCFDENEADDQDVLYIDDMADPDVLYMGDDEGPVDVNGYPTELEPDDTQERS